MPAQGHAVAARDPKLGVWQLQSLPRARESTPELPSSPLPVAFVFPDSESLGLFHLLVCLLICGPAPGYKVTQVARLPCRHVCGGGTPTSRDVSKQWFDN